MITFDTNAALRLNAEAGMHRLINALMAGFHFPAINAAIDAGLASFHQDVAPIVFFRMAARAIPPSRTTQRQGE